MGHLNSTNLAESTGISREGRQGAKGRGWLWFIAVVIVAAVAVWYFRGRFATEAQGPTARNAGGGSSKGPGRGGPGGGSFTVPVVVVPAQKGDLPIYLNGLGTVTAFNTVTVRSRIDGQIVKINFQEGQMVQQGQSLVEIDPRPYQVQLEQAEGQLARDQAQLRNVNVDYERYQLLYKEGVIPKQQVDTQAAQVGQFEGTIKSDQAAVDNAKLQLVYCHITAPIGGRVGLRLVDIGNIVHANDANGLLVITQLQPIAVIFTLPQDQLSQVMAKLRAEKQLSVNAYDRDDTTKIATGKLLTIDNQIDPTTGTYKLKAIFPNENNLLFPNQFVNMHLLVDIAHNVTLVPVQAIQRGPQGTYVYQVEQNNRVKIQPVTTSTSTNDVVAVTAGLQPGDIVVTDGQDKLQEGSQVEPHSSTSAEAPVNAPSHAPNKPAGPANARGGSRR